MQYIASDAHFQHKNILNSEPGRSHYTDVTAMNEDIIAYWNAVVTNEDTVYFLGDAGLGSPTKVAERFARLNGNILFYPGNHDTTKILKAIEETCPRVTMMPYMTRMKFDGVQVFLSHFPADVGRRATLFSVHGHIHSNLGSTNQINVCMDNDFWDVPFGQPIPLDRVKAHILSLRDQLEQELYPERTEEPS